MILKGTKDDDLTLKYLLEQNKGSGEGGTVSVKVGSTTTGAAGTSAKVINTGTDTNVVLDFLIPRGDKGDTGATGSTGPAGQGVASGGTTGQILKKKSNTDYDTEWGNEATAPVTSVDGKTGAVAILPTGGDATSSVLAKNSATNYDVRWRTINDWNEAGLCRTKANNASKYAEWSFWVAKADSYVLVTFVYANSYAGPITLNINGTGAKPVYINGAASSSSNYTLPAGSYIGYYDGTNFYFRTDKKIPADITGTAGNGIPTGGSSGQVLQKASGNDYDTEWATPSGGGGNGLEMKLLWFNSDPTADFAAQTIPLSLSTYDAVYVQCGTSTGQVNDENLLPVVVEGTTYGSVQYIGYSSANVRSYRRDIEVTTSGVTFGGCARHTQGTSGTTTVATALKCLRIYGIKGIT